MQTLSWFALGLSGVVLLLLAAILIVLTLSRDPIGKREGLKKNGKDKSGVLPSTGGDTGKRVTDWLQSMFTVQTLALIAAFNALELALYSSNWFPHLFEWPNVLHTLTYSALIVIASLLVKQQKGMVRTLALASVIAASAIFTKIFFDNEIKRLTAWWNTERPASVQTTRAPAAPERRGARAPADPCDNVYRTYRLSNRPKPMLRVSGCTVGWMVEEGGVILTDEDGNKQPPVRKDEDRGYGPPAKMWQGGGRHATAKTT